MMPDNPFPALSPAMARERFVIRDDSWGDRFKPDFNQFIIAPIEYARPIIKLPVPPGRTANYAIFLLTDGSIDMTVGHEAYTLSVQKLIVIPALQIFSITAISDDARGFMCFFSQETLRQATNETDFSFLKLTSRPLIPLSVTQGGFIRNLLDRLHTEYTESGASKTDLIWPYLLTLLAEINRAYVGTSPAHTDAGDRLVQRFTDSLTAHIRQHRLVSDYANRLNVSPNHLNKVVKARTGRSPSIWIDERIVLEAKVLLFQSSLTVAQIAGELGFDDQANFGKLFRKYAHLSPTAFRRMIDSDQSSPGMS